MLSVEEDDERKRAEIINRIRELYKAGIPFFTMERLEEVARQLKACRETANQTERKISTRGIDGKQVDFPVLTGRTCPIRIRGDEGRF